MTESKDPKPEASAPAMPENRVYGPSPECLELWKASATDSALTKQERIDREQGVSYLTNCHFIFRASPTETGPALMFAAENMQGCMMVGLHGYTIKPNEMEDADKSESERLACEVQRLETENRELLLDMAELHPMDDCAQEIHDLRESKQALEDMIRADAKTLEFLQGTGPIALIGHPLAEVAAHTIDALQAQVRDLQTWKDARPLHDFESLQALYVEALREQNDLQSRLEEAERKLNSLPEPESALQKLGQHLADLLGEDRWNEMVDYLEAARIDRDHHKADASRLAEALERLIPGDDDQCAADKPFAIEALRLHREGR